MTDDGKPSLVVVPNEASRRMCPDAAQGLVPDIIVNRMFDTGLTPMAAWREHRRLTQDEVAARLGISQSAYAQMETGKRPRKATLNKVAQAMGLEVEQLAW